MTNEASVQTSSRTKHILLDGGALPAACQRVLIPEGYKADKEEEGCASLKCKGRRNIATPA